MPIRTLIIVLLAVAVVSGCGRRGNLEQPGATVADDEAARALPSDGISPLDPGSSALAGEPASEPPSPRDQRRFFLDFLL
jgi:predicted small lipoprotein YifL